MPESRKRRVTRELAEEAQTIKPNSELKSTAPDKYKTRLEIYKSLCSTLDLLNNLLDSSEEYDPARNRGRIEKTWD